ncbi:MULTISPECIES: high frequency lysogenization protein HflD [unclassified Agarivorans]|uniref:high frequency lysogenization protein HflD n=1 Tax=unclassified Agarivorans TaxID=2636026 RepID=UPI0026E42304|nr:MULTISPECIES: high frequency lysogenization protein HflD [unclassified Agarivorans]MDO6684973.1 high frequency lysogenization protein HflD [Agarivorans sp. 3_MG-2023]MDO6714866.1 high frequency lysogenization protein HflD [Agarivorans sp. 2_MG-2023]
MSNPLSDRVIAFAGICQAAKLVQDVARTSNCEEAGLSTCLNSILVTSPDQTVEVFGSLEELKLGLGVMNAQLSSQQEKRNAEITRYLVSLLALERRLNKRPDLMNMMGERITQLDRQLQHFNLLDQQVLGGIADIYSDIISPLGPRIQVAGNVSYLQQPVVQHKVRALLLAGIRACVLWRQLGGQRRQLLFSRKNYLQQTSTLLHTID